MHRRVTKQSELEGETDVDESNGGIAFLGQGDDAYWRWEDIATVELH